MKILVINSGSSSIKFKLFDMANNKNLASGIVEEIGNKNSKAKMSVANSDEKFELKEEIKDHQKGIEIVNDFLKKAKLVNSLKEIDGIGHRVVQGGDKFNKSVIIDDYAIKTIEELSVLAPLHNPGHIAGIKSVMAEAPNVKNVVVFDTVFHQSMPEFAYRYAIPNEYYEKFAIRKYGFHGTSHKFVSENGAKFLGIENSKFNAITLHIGNGASISAIKNGKCFDTSMGLTPLEGLIMGTRCGDIDPAVMSFISDQTKMSAREVDTIFNKKSGLLGICGSSDLRDIEEAIENGCEISKLAFDMYIHRIVKYVGSYYAILGNIDALIFTAGVGENSSLLRQRVCDAVAHFGVNLDYEKNGIRSPEIRDISTQNSKIKVLVVPTDEELAIALDTLKLIQEK